MESSNVQHHNAVAINASVSHVNVGDISFPGATSAQIPIAQARPTQTQTQTQVEDDDEDAEGGQVDNKCSHRSCNVRCTGVSYQRHAHHGPNLPNLLSNIGLASWRISFKIKIESVRNCTFSFVHHVAAFCLFIRNLCLYIRNLKHFKWNQSENFININAYISGIQKSVKRNRGIKWDQTDLIWQYVCRGLAKQSFTNKHYLAIKV